MCVYIRKHILSIPRESTHSLTNEIRKLWFDLTSYVRYGHRKEIPFPNEKSIQYNISHGF